MELQFSPVIFEDSTKYVKEIFAGEHIGINIELVGLKQDGSRWHVRHTFRRNDTVAALHDVKGAWLDTARRRIAAPPGGLLEACTNLPRASDYAEIVSVAGKGESALSEDQEPSVGARRLGSWADFLCPAKQGLR